MTAVAIVATALVACLFFYVVGHRRGARRGFDAGVGYTLASLPEVMPISEQHHHDLHAEVDILRMALSEANRRLADTGVTISVEEITAFYDIAQSEDES